MEIEELAAVLRKCWSKETTLYPEYWTPENPAIEQCCVTALVVQDYFGGEILQKKFPLELKTGPAVKYFTVSHFWNLFPSGEEIDLTKEQFPSGTVIPKGIRRKREHLLKIHHVKERYELLKSRVEKLIKRKGGEI